MHDERLELARTLDRIAAALEVPIEALFVPRRGQTGPSKAEIDALLTIFISLDDIQARNRIFAAALAEMPRLQSGAEVVPDGRV